MKTSSTDAVRQLYEASADSYAAMMDSEIDLPLYASVLSRLKENLSTTPGILIDTSCGSGHMLSMYHEQFDAVRPLLGIDVSPSMVKIASARLGTSANVSVGDMRELPMVDDGAAAAVISFFVLHHLEPPDVRAALGEWCRVLVPGGHILIAAWEGEGAIDYGDSSDVVALRYGEPLLSTWTREAGFTITRSVVEPVDGMEMDAVYLEAFKE